VGNNLAFYSTTIPRAQWVCAQDKGLSDCVDILLPKSHDCCSQNVMGANALMIPSFDGCHYIKHAVEKQLREILFLVCISPSISTRYLWFSFCCYFRMQCFSVIFLKLLDKLIVVRQDLKERHKSFFDYIETHNRERERERLKKLHITHYKTYLQKLL